MKILISYTITNDLESKSYDIKYDEFRIDNGTIITEACKDEKNFNGKIIKFIPLWEWLLTIETVGEVDK